MTDKNHDGCASTQSVAGLAREVEQLSRRLDGLGDLPGKVKQLARTVTQLAAEVAQSPTAGATSGEAVSWLNLPDDVEYTRQVLDDLTSWMDHIYLRYADAVTTLPNCWLWHPDVVEELLWLKQAWSAAYASEDATVARAADWHDRYRPGVVRHIGKLAPNCSLENHDHRDGPVRSGAGVPALSAVPAIAHWWGSNKYGHPPQPTDEQLAEDTPDERRGGGRR